MSSPKLVHANELKHKDPHSIESLALYGFATEEAMLSLSLFPNLTELSIANMVNRQDNFSRFISTLVNLEVLDCQTSCLNDSSLSNLSHLIHLKKLNLSTTHIAGAGLRHLSSLENLEELDLSNTLVSDGSLKHLTGLIKLTKLNLRDTRVTSLGVDSLHQSLSVTYDQN